jgi:hypothetical protein
VAGVLAGGEQPPRAGDQFARLRVDQMELLLDADRRADRRVRHRLIVCRGR